ncbi:hypothetical protein AOLI_G00124950 [Acnodon oligacanthus]
MLNKLMMADNIIILNDMLEHDIYSRDVVYLVHPAVPGLPGEVRIKPCLHKPVFLSHPSTASGFHLIRTCGLCQMQPQRVHNHKLAVTVKLTRDLHMLCPTSQS